MFRHVVVMKFNHQLTTEERDQVKQALDDLGEQSPDVRQISHGFDLGVRAGGYDLALVADFDDADGWQAYSAHPAHDVVRTVMGPIVEGQTVVQFYLPDGTA